MTRSSSSSYLDSIYGKGSLELVWENDQLHVQQRGSSSSVTRVTPSCEGYSIKAIDEGAMNAKSARLSSLYSLMDFRVQRDSGLETSQPNSHQSKDQNSCKLALEKTNKFSKACSSKGPEGSLVIESYKGSQCHVGFERQNHLVSDASNSVSRSEETPPDEQSETAGHNVCSRKHDDIDDSTYLSDDDEETEYVVKEKPTRRGVKRSRNAQVRNLCERKRRDKINKRMRILKELIPNCNKTDKASMLDAAIEYLKNLKLQLQIMSMGAGFCMPFMMLPNATHHMMNTHLHQLMGFRPGTTIPLGQFPITPMNGFTDNRVQMFGFPNQVPSMPISHAPFIPMVGNPFKQHLATSTTLMASVPKNSSYLSGQAEYAKKQALNQVSLHHEPSV